jgi:hypothetical protein
MTKLADITYVYQGFEAGKLGNMTTVNLHTHTHAALYLDVPQANAGIQPPPSLDCSLPPLPSLENGQSTCLDVVQNFV